MTGVVAVSNGRPRVAGPARNALSYSTVTDFARLRG